MMIAIFLFIIFLILLLGHALLYVFVVSIFSISNPIILLDFKLLAGLLSITFILGSVGSSVKNNIVTKYFYRASAIWLSFLIYLFFAAVVYDIALIFGVALVFGQALFLLALGLSIYGLIHAQNIKKVHLKINLPNLPDAWMDRKAVFMSDLHLGQVRERPFLEKIVSLIQKENPDVVFISGDVFDGVKVDAKDIVSPFKNLRPPHGIFFVMGNHEEFRDNTDYREALIVAGVTILENEIKMIDGIQIVGVDYKSAEKRSNFDDVLGSFSINKNIPSILLKHVPSDLDVAEKRGVSLGLFGHTHRAQVFPFSIITHFVYKGFDYGFKKLGNMQVYTSSGVGTWGPPIRVGSNSEIVIFNF